MLKNVLKSRFNLLNIVFVAQLFLFILIVIGVLPRETSIILASLLVMYVSAAKLEDGVIFFLRSIPLFIAIPITDSFDNLNTWRILAVVIFLKWFLEGSFGYYRIVIADWLKSLNIFKPSLSVLALLVVSFMSIAVARDKAAAVTRIIYFINISMVGMVVYDLIRRNGLYAERVVRNICIPLILVVLIGYIQVISTYFIDIYQFMRIWGEGIQMKQFGLLWSEIAIKLGNTWFAYYGDQLSLRVFSLFPDSHSFPQFVLLALSSIFAMSLGSVLSVADRGIAAMLRTRGRMLILWIPAGFLITILSGTRGIWAASVGVIVLSFLALIWMRKRAVPAGRKNIFKYSLGFVAVFYLLFAVAYPIFVSPQFLVSKGDWGLLSNRIKSIVDFGETSNSQRIEIWKASFDSIIARPILGVGIGNFPVVLDQRIFLSRAGSSAHNIYLHVGAEMGFPAMIIMIWFLWLVYSRIYSNFVSAQGDFWPAYWAANLLFVPWVLIYSLTDIALFDERSFLLFISILGLIFANKNPRIGAGVRV